MNIKKTLINEIRHLFDRQEQGAILGARNNCVVEYYYDVIGSSRASNCSYEPDTESINIVLSKWAKLDIAFCGIVHSHPATKKTLSIADVEYGKVLCSAFELNEVLMPIAIPETTEIFFYTVDLYGNIEKLDMKNADMTVV